jgi:hypothetical protein
MGNKPSAPPPPLPTINLNPRDNGVFDAFNNTFNPDKNNVGNSFDPNGNGFMGKIKTDADNAFQKGGAGNNILRKIGDVSERVGDAEQMAGNAMMAGGTALSFMGAPHIGVPLGIVGGALSTTGTIVKKGGSISTKTAQTIEKPKKNFDPKWDVPKIFF